MFAVGALEDGHIGVVHLAVAVGVAELPEEVGGVGPELVVAADLAVAVAVQGLAVLVVYLAGDQG